MLSEHKFIKCIIIKKRKYTKFILLRSQEIFCAYDTKKRYIQKFEMFDHFLIKYSNT